MPSSCRLETACFLLAFLSHMLTLPTHPDAISQTVGTFANKSALPWKSLATPQDYPDRYCVQLILPQFGLPCYNFESSGLFLRSMRILPPNFPDSFPSYLTSSCSTTCLPFSSYSRSNSYQSCLHATSAKSSRSTTTVSHFFNSTKPQLICRCNSTSPSLSLCNIITNSPVSDFRFYVPIPLATGSSNVSKHQKTMLKSCALCKNESLATFYPS